MLFALFVYSLSVKAVDIKVINLASRRILEQGGPILALALLDPVAVHSKCAAIDDLSQHLDAVGVS